MSLAVTAAFACPDSKTAEAQPSPAKAVAAAPAKAVNKAALRAQIMERTGSGQDAQQAYFDEAGGFRHAENDEPMQQGLVQPAATAFTPKISANVNGGGTRASLGGSAMHFSVVHRHADCSLHSNCVEEHDLPAVMKSTNNKKVEVSNDR